MNRNEIIDAEYSVVSTKEYKPVESFFLTIPDIVKPLSVDVVAASKDLEKMLRVSPSLIKVIKSIAPEEMLVAAFTDGQKRQLAEGALEILTKKNGALMATLRDPVTKKIVTTVDLKKVTFSPELTSSLASLSTQMQMAQIAKKIEKLQIAVEQVKNGLETDRLATAYSLQQKFLHACAMKNLQLRTEALLRVTMDAEDSRNLLMLSQRNNLKFILDQPESVAGKFLASINTKDNDNTIACLRESMCALNMASLVESLAYQQLGEPELAAQSLNYHSNFIKNTYGNMSVLKRLDGLDPEPTKYWSSMLPAIQKQLLELSNNELNYIGYKETRNNE